MSKINESTDKINHEHLDSGSHFQILHGRHDSRVCLATKNDQGWKQKTYEHGDVLAIIHDLSQDFESDIYISQAGFNKKRCVQDVSVLPAIFVDLDTYKVNLIPYLSDEKPEKVLEIVSDKYPWLPTPTLLAFSGQGLYFIWILEQPLTRDRLQDWQLIEELLIEKMQCVGADIRAKDAARVLRVCDSINTKSGETVTYKQIAEPISFDVLKEKVLENCQRKEVKVKEAPKQKSNKPALVYTNEKKIKRSTVIRRTKPNQGKLAFLDEGIFISAVRMRDLRKLASMRAPLTDYRKRFLFCFAIAACWFCPNQEAIHRELTIFSQDFFKDPENYGIQNVKNLLEKIGQERYMIKTQTIINMLDVTINEQEKLEKLVITYKVIKSRIYKKRREAGVRPQAEYLAQQSAEYEQRKQRAKSMREQGYKLKKIAQELGITIRSVQRYLSH